MSSSKINQVGDISQITPLKYFGSSLNASDDAKHEALPEHLRRFAETSDIDKTTSKITDARLVNSISERYKAQAHHVETKTQRIFVIAFSYFIHVLSFAVSFAAAFTLMVQVMPRSIAFIVSTLILFFIELGKRFCIIPAVRQYTIKRKFDLFSILISICLLCASLYLNYNGAIETVSLTDEAPTLIKGDSVTNNDRQYIGDIHAQIKDTKKHYSWHGKLTEKGREETEHLNAMLAGVQNRISKTTDRTNAENDKTTATHESKLTERSTALKFATVFLDLLLVVFIFFLESLDYQSYLHLLELQKKNVPQGNAPSNALQSNAFGTMQNANAMLINNNDIQRNKIGFRHYSTQTEEPLLNAHYAISREENKALNETLLRNEYAEPIIKICQHCGKDYERKTTWQKYCKEICKIEAHELRTGKKFTKRKSK